MAARGVLLRHRDFRRLWAGETVSELGTQVSLLAIPLVAVRTLHATTLQVGLLAAAATVPFLVVGLPAGALIDRMRRRRVMIAADLGRLLALGSIPVTYALGHLGLAQLYAVALVAGGLTVFFDVAYQSYLPSLVGLDNVIEGNAKLIGSAQVSQVAGPSIAGLLIQAIGGAYAVALDAGSFLFSGAAITAIRAKEPRPAVPEGGHPRLHRDIAEGLRFVFGQPLLRAITACTTSCNFFSGVMTAVEVVFLVRVVHAQPGVIGLLFAAVGLGGLIGAFSASAVARRFGGARSLFVGLLFNSAALLIPLTQPGAGLLFFAVGYCLTAFGTVIYNVNQVSFRQVLCPERLLGRMNATIRFLVFGVTPIGGLAGGVIGTAIGLRPTLWVAAVGEFCSLGWLLASPIRRMRDFPARSADVERVAEQAERR
jgi:MFS family permease